MSCNVQVVCSIEVHVFFSFIICENVSVPFEELIQHSYMLLFCSLLMSFCG